MTNNGKIHIDLEADGLPGQWVDVANVGLKSPKQFQQIQELASDSAPESAKAFIAFVIPSWFIKNPTTGEPIPRRIRPSLISTTSR